MYWGLSVISQRFVHLFIIRREQKYFFSFAILSRLWQVGNNVFLSSLKNREQSLHWLLAGGTGLTPFLLWRCRLLAGLRKPPRIMTRPWESVIRRPEPSCRSSVGLSVTEHHGSPHLQTQLCERKPLHLWKPLKSCFLRLLTWNDPRLPRIQPTILEFLAPSKFCQFCRSLEPELSSFPFLSSYFHFISVLSSFIRHHKKIFLVCSLLTTF